MDHTVTRRTGTKRTEDRTEYEFATHRRLLHETIMLRQVSMLLSSCTYDPFVLTRVGCRRSYINHSQAFRVGVKRESALAIILVRQQA